MYLILANIVWILYALFEGYRESYYWFFKTNSNVINNYEMHPLFELQRGIVLLLIFVNLLLLTNPIVASLNIISNALLFSYFHNGIYYLTRNKLDNNVYKLKWKDDSTTSTAKTERFFKYKYRTAYVIIGGIITILSIIIK